MCEFNENNLAFLRLPRDANQGDNSLYILRTMQANYHQNMADNYDSDCQGKTDVEGTVLLSH